jgi:hypothetical protein
MAQETWPITNYQFVNGNPVAFGYLIIHLDKDAVSSTGQVSSRVKVKLSLDGAGMIVSGPVFWPNSQLTPTDTLYIYSVYTQAGQRILGPLSLLVGIIAPSTGFGEAFGSSFGS